MRGTRGGEDDDLVVIDLDDEEPTPAAPTPARADARHERRTHAIAAVTVVALVAAAALLAVRAEHHGRHALLPFATGTALVTADGVTLHRVDVDTGAERTVRYDALAQPGPVTLTLATRDAVVAALPSAPNSPVLSTYLVPSDLAGMPVPLATSADALVASPDGRHLVLAKSDSGNLFEVDVRGRVVEEPGGDAFYPSPLAALRNGFVTAGWNYHELDGDTTVVRDGRVIGAGGTRVAWVRACDAARCPLLVTDVDGGADHAFAEPALAPLLSPYFAAGVSMNTELLGRVSSDGRHLVVVGPDRSVVLVDLDTGVARRLRVWAFDLHSVAWSPDGRTLFVLDTGSRRPRLVAVVPETGATHALDARIGAGTSSLVAVPGPSHGPRRAPAPAPTTTSTAVPNRPVLGTRTGLDLVAVGSDAIDTVDLDTGATAREALPAPVSTYEGDDSFAPIPDDTGRRPLTVGDRVVFLRYGHAYSARASLVVDLGDALGIFPSQTPGRVWTVSSSAGDGTTSGVPVHEVEVADGRITQTTTLPGEPLGTTDRGFVVRIGSESASGVHVGLATGGAAARGVYGAPREDWSSTTVLAAAGDHVVLADRSCAYLHVVAVDSATTRDVPLFARGASLAPDGHTLALAGGQPDTWTLLDVDGLSFDSIPSLGLADSTPVWSPDGRWLFGWSYTAVTARSAADGQTYDVPAAAGATRFAVAAR